MTDHHTDVVVVAALLAHSILVAQMWPNQVMTVSLDAADLLEAGPEALVPAVEVTVELLALGAPDLSRRYDNRLSLNVLTV